MRKFYGMLTFMSLLASLAGIGSFFVAVMPHVDDNYRQTPSVRLQHRDESPFIGNPPVTQERDQRRAQLSRVCNWQPYQEKARRLRETHARGTQSQPAAYLWLGTDAEFEYFYDFGADAIFCRARADAGGPLVSGGGTVDREAARRRLVLLLIVVMAVCVVLLHMVQVARSRRHGRP